MAMPRPSSAACQVSTELLKKHPLGAGGAVGEALRDQPVVPVDTTELRNQQRPCQQLFALADATVNLQIGGRAHVLDLVAEQQVGLGAGPVAGAELDRQVDAVAIEIDVGHGRHDPHVRARMSLLE